MFGMNMNGMMGGQPQQGQGQQGMMGGMGMMSGMNGMMSGGHPQQGMMGGMGMMGGQPQQGMGMMSGGQPQGMMGGMMGGLGGMMGGLTGMVGGGPGQQGMSPPPLICFKSHHGTFIGVDHVGHIKAVSQCKDTEKYFAKEIYGGKVAIFSSTGMCLGVDKHEPHVLSRPNYDVQFMKNSMDKEINCNWWLDRLPNGKYNLRSCHDTWIGVDPEGRVYHIDHCGEWEQFDCGVDGAPGPDVYPHIPAPKPRAVQTTHVITAPVVHTVVHEVHAPVVYHDVHHQTVVSPVIHHHSPVVMHQQTYTTSTTTNSSQFKHF